MTNPFQLNKHDTTAVFIDGPALYWAFKTLGREALIDMIKIRDFIADNSRMRSINYYTIFQPHARADGYDPIKPLAEFLGYNGFRIVSRDAEHYQTDLGTRVRGSINVDLACDATIAGVRGVDHIILFVNDGDFNPLIHTLRDQGCTVTVVSTAKERVVSDELVWPADSFIDLDKVAHLIERVTTS